jgi:hypothetical protein
VFTWGAGGTIGSYEAREGVTGGVTSADQLCFTGRQGPGVTIESWKAGRGRDRWGHFS